MAPLEMVEKIESDIMGIIKDKFKHILEFNLAAQTELVVNQNRTRIINLNKKQLDEGTDTEGKFLPTYSPFSVEQKQGRNAPVPPSETFNLKDSGKFHKGMYAKANRKAITFTTSDKKLDDVLNNQINPSKNMKDEDVFGLNDRNKEELVNKILLPEFLNTLRGL